MANNNSKVNMTLPQGTVLKQNVCVVSNSTTPVADNVVNPSVMSIGYIPTIGDGNTLLSGSVDASANRISTIDTAFSKYYQKLRGKNSSLSSYTAADVGKVLIALDSLYGLLAENEIDILSLVDVKYESYAFRGALRNALWNQPDVARANLSNIVKRHNLMCNDLKALPFIPDVPYLKDHIDWASKVYKDDNLDKSSLIIFRRSGYYYYEVDSTDPDPGFLMLRNAVSTYSYSEISTPLAAETRMDIIDMLIKTYTTDDDFQNICAEIYKAYDMNPEFYSVNKIPEDPTNLSLKLDYDLDVIDSLRNADFMKLVLTTGYNAGIYGISEDGNGHLTYAIGSATNHANVFPVVNIDNDTNAGAYVLADTGQYRVLNMYDNNPTEEAIRVTTRYVHKYSAITGGNMSYVYGLKSEYLTGIKLDYYDPSTASGWNSTTITRWLESTARVSVVDALVKFSPMVAFPQIHLLSTNNGGYTGNHYPLRKDLDNVGYIDVSWLIQTAREEMQDKFVLGKANKSKSENA